MTEDQIRELLISFEKTFRQKLKAASKCGALDGTELPFVVGKAVLRIAADGFELPLAHREIEANLRKFI